MQTEAAGSTAPLSMVAEHQAGGGSRALQQFLSLPDEQRRLGAFHLERQLGRGGFAPVWLASEKYDGVRIRSAAVKLFAFDEADEGASSGHRERIIREARALCQVEHANIVRFYAILTEESWPIAGLAMEHLPGASLADRLKRHGPLSVAETVRVGIAVASALDAGHRAGIVHRDVKPGNVMESPGGYKLIDFGIATVGEGTQLRARPRAERHVLQDEIPVQLGRTRMTILADPDGPASTVPGIVASGTLGYIDPACVAGGVEATTASDLYSLGVLLFECLTGDLPAKTTSSRMLLGSVLDGRSRAPSIAERVPAVPRRLSDLVDALLAPDRGARPDSAGAVLAELEAVASELLGHDTPSRARTGRGLPSWALIAIASTLPALALFIALTSSRSPAAPIPPVPATSTGAAANAAPVPEAPVSSATPEAPRIVRGPVTIVPRDARVTVDGQRRMLDANGVLSLQGEPGATFRVVVEAMGRSHSASVVLSRDGRATPGRVELSPLKARVSASIAADPKPDPVAPAPPRLVPKDDF